MLSLTFLLSYYYKSQTKYSINHFFFFPLPFLSVAFLAASGFSAASLAFFALIPINLASSLACNHITLLITHKQTQRINRN